ncbi:hypothetical protein KM043_009117 [Ampulex compressa]|nr:hypothetical protein KM043_009117 [Ampulex compressa]
MMDNHTLINADDGTEHIANSTGNDFFDEIIGHIEDLLLEEEFHSIQQHFLDKYWEIFEPVEENKLIYTDVFNEYNKAVENYIVNYLQKVIPNFDMNILLQYLNDKRAELEGEVFEVLSTFTDFVAFKEMFLDYRAVKEGKVQDLSCGISITSVNSGNTHHIDPPR